MIRLCISAGYFTISENVIYLVIFLCPTWTPVLSRTFALYPQPWPIYLVYKYDNVVFMLSLYRRYEFICWTYFVLIMVGSVFLYRRLLHRWIQYGVQADAVTRVAWPVSLVLTCLILPSLPFRTLASVTSRGQPASPSPWLKASGVAVAYYAGNRSPTLPVLPKLPRDPGWYKTHTAW